MDFTGKKIVVIGAGISGNAAAMLAKKRGAAQVILSDANEKAAQKYNLEKVKKAGVNILFGAQGDALLEGASHLILSPAVPIGNPLVQKAKENGIEVWSEIEFAYRVARSPIYAITGTNGKTTTTALLGELMKRLPQKVGIGGNIGVALCSEADRVADGGCIVAEISSYQLEASASFRPHIAAVLNVTPDHITRHGSMECYQKTKEKIFANQTAEDFLVLNYDDERVRPMAERAQSTVCFFSREKELVEGAFIKDGFLTIVWRGGVHKICRAQDMKIKGAHNIENALAAAAMAFLAGVGVLEIQAGLIAFAGVEHRIEPVREVGGVMYYNDSKATNTDSAVKALETFPNGHVILIAGGTDKLTDLTQFMRLVKERVDALILIGAAAARFRREAEKNGVTPIYDAGASLAKAVDLAHSIAKPSQVVLLSPACASFDMFDGYEQRGKAFKHLVNAL